MQYRHLALAATLALASTGAWATPCDGIKDQVEAKLKAHGVKAYTLTAVDAGEVKDQKVVGSCEGGKKKIVYKRS